MLMFRSCRNFLNSVFVASSLALQGSLRNLYQANYRPSQIPTYSTCSSKMPLAPVIALSHGGGPMPLLGDPSQKALADSMRNRVPAILKLNTPEAPRAVVLITAHWSETKPTISTGAKVKLYYDYGGFPAEAYKIKHDAPGAPDVASEVQSVLKEAGIKFATDSERGWDHGVFVPMKLIDPKAKVPIVQMSVLSSEDPEQHFAFGKALGKLRERNVAIVGSGFASMHNLRAMFSGQISQAEYKVLAKSFSEKLNDAIETDDSKERGNKLKAWREFPGSYEMHPRGGAEHFLPLIVCAGAASGPGKSYTDEFMNLEYFTYYWED
jgi:aromatic ring-opening dioxygenase catalytic subunit (LigB family)